MSDCCGVKEAAGRAEVWCRLSQHLLGGGARPWLASGASRACLAAEQEAAAVPAAVGGTCCRLQTLTSCSGGGGGAPGINRPRAAATAGRRGVGRAAADVPGRQIPAGPAAARPALKARRAGWKSSAVSVAGEWELDHARRKLRLPRRNSQILCLSRT